MYVFNRHFLKFSISLQVDFRRTQKNCFVPQCNKLKYEGKIQMTLRTKSKIKFYLKLFFYKISKY